MSINLFLLEKKDLIKLDTLVLLKDVRYITVKEIKTTFKISDYHAKKIIQNLYNEIKTTDYASEFEYVNSMFICKETKNIDLLITTLINNYYRKSKKTRFIIEWILLNHKMTEIAERVDLSVSKIYELKDEFNIFVEKYVRLSEQTYEIFYRRILLTIFVGSPDLLLEYDNEEVDKFIQTVLFSIEPLCIVELNSENIAKMKSVLLVTYFRSKNNKKISEEIFNFQQFSPEHINVIKKTLLLLQSKDVKVKQSDFFFYIVVSLLLPRSIYLNYLKEDVRRTNCF